MIRPAATEDSQRIIDVVVAAGLFDVGDVGVVRDLLAGHFRDAREDICLVGVEAGSLTGVAYARPAPAADRVWYLTMIGVLPSAQRAGTGTALLRGVEARLTAGQQRLLLVETSALPGYKPARHFYAHAGYREEARVRDFHEDGDDMVLYWKRLTAQR